jgi:poly-beta-1,6-N-acetyl-D-glucosamine synthase
MQAIGQSLGLGVYGASVLAILYTYLGYPWLIRRLARRSSSSVSAAESAGEGGAAPTRCCVVIAAHDEADTLPAKLRQWLQGENGACIEAIWVGSDGSDDGTEEAVAAIGDARIQVRRFATRRGKPSVLNDLVAACQSEVVVFTDARQEIGEAALPRLLAHFADPRMGVVSGELVFRDPATGSATATGMGTYWRYEKSIRRAEAQYRSVPGATGALYALRRSLYRPIPADTLLDDVVIPMQAVEQGYRCIFDSEAVVFDQPSTSGRAEQIRKRRTIAGNIQLLRLFPRWLHPARNPIWFEFVSHKMLRLFSPLFLVLLALTNALLLAGAAGLIWGWLGLTLAGQAVFYALAAVGFSGAAQSAWFAAPALFVRLNTTTLQAWWDAWRGRYRVAWDRSRSS